MLGFVLCLWDLPPRNFTAGSGGVSTVVRQVEKKKIIKKQTNSQEEGVYSQVDRCRDVHQSSTLKKMVPSLSSSSSACAHVSLCFQSSDG